MHHGDQIVGNTLHFYRYYTQSYLLKLILKEPVGRVWTGVIVSEHGPTAVCFVHGSEHPGSITGKTLLDQMSRYNT
jgi:hypothetical protein